MYISEIASQCMHAWPGCIQSRVVSAFDRSEAERDTDYNTPPAALAACTWPCRILRKPRTRIVRCTVFLLLLLFTGPHVNNICGYMTKNRL